MLILTKIGLNRENSLLISFPVADPGFPAGGGTNTQHGYVSYNLYVKTKESGPLGGHRVHPLGSASAFYLW